jgi:hypothetical protein
VHKTIQRIRTKLEEPRVLAHTVYCLRSCDRTVRLRVATALARLAPESAHRSVFVERPAALDVLLGALTDANVTTGAPRAATSVPMACTASTLWLWYNRPCAGWVKPNLVPFRALPPGRPVFPADAQAESAAALLELSNKVNASAPIDAAPAQPAKVGRMAPLLGAARLHPGC